MLGGKHWHEGGIDRRSVLKSVGAAGAGLALGAGSTGSAAAVGESALLQFYHTPWNEVRNHLGGIADAGFGAIQLPPAQYSKLTWADQDGDNHPPLGYQPIDHKNFTSQFGTEGEYKQLIDAAHGNGLDVVADAVINHMAADTAFSEFPHFGYDDFHHNGAIEDYSDDWQVENCDLVGLPDLKQESAYVRGQLKDYVDKYADLGIDGIRWDAAKHVPEWFFSDYANQWAEARGLYRVGEVLQGSVDYCEGYVNTGMSATDYPLYYVMKEDVFTDGGDMRALDGAGLVNRRPFGSLTFVSNHDSDPPQYQKLAYAFILTYEGYPRVYQKDMPYWDGDIKNLLWIRNTLSGGAALTRHVDQNLYLYEREGNLLVGLNRSDSWQGQWVPTSWTNQTLNDYSGNAGDVTTNGDSWVEVWVPPRGWVCYAP